MTRISLTVLALAVGCFATQAYSQTADSQQVAPGLSTPSDTQTVIKHRVRHARHKGHLAVGKTKLTHRQHHRSVATATLRHHKRHATVAKATLRTHKRHATLAKWTPKHHKVHAVIAKTKVKIAHRKTHGINARLTHRNASLAKTKAIHHKARLSNANGKRKITTTARKNRTLAGAELRHGKPAGLFDFVG